MAGIQSISITSYGDSGADGAVTYADLAALKASQLPATGSSKLAFVQSRHAWFSWDATSTLTANDLDVVVSTANGASDGRWIRLKLTHQYHQSFAEWYIDTGAGNDDNTGASGSPLRTCREFTLRMAGVATRSYNVYVTGNILTGDPLAVVAFFNTDYGVSASNFDPVIRVYGTPTLVRSGTISAVATPVVATNTPGSITDASATWATSISNRYAIKLTSGAGSGKWMWPCKDLGGSAVRVNNPYSETGTVGTFPSVNDTYEEYSLPTGSWSYSGNCSAVFTYWDTTLSLQGAYTASKTSGLYMCAVGNAQALLCPNANIVACRDNGTSAWGLVFPQRYAFVGCTSMQAALSVRNGAVIYLQGCLFQGVGLSTSNTATNLPAHITIGTTGFMDHTGTAVDISRGTTCKMSSSVWGANNLVGCKVSSGGKIIVETGYTPTLTGTTELSVAGVANLLPPLEAYAGLVLPAVAPCTTWAQWAAAPFNRGVLHYLSGAQIVST